MKRASRRDRGLTARQYYALIWKDFVVHKRHYVWTLLEVTIPVLVCAMAILSNSHPGKPKLESERVFEQDDYERLYGDLNPQHHKLLIAPNSSFTRALVDQIDDGAMTIELVGTEAELVELIKREIPVSLDQVKRLLPDDSANVTVGGVVVRSDAQQVARRPGGGGDLKSSNYFEVVSKLDGQPMKIPVNLELAIRAKDFRLGPEPFPKKYSLGPFLHSDHYQATFFMASQIMLSRAYISLLASYLNGTLKAPANASNAASAASWADILVPTNEELVGQRMPYPKYVAHKRLKETTLGTFVAGSQKQKPFVLTMDYCVCVGFLVTAIFLAKRIVDEKKSRVRDMLRLVGIHDLTYYGSHVTNTMLIMLLQCALITLLFTGHQEAPAQNIDSTLLFAILLIYCLAAIMFVLALSTLFNSSTKAIIFTSLLWLGLPEIIDRIFKMDSGVIESNGFLAVGEHYHLLFCLLPNFGLRLMNRLLTECDIYGEFYNKKELYGEYRAIWPNIHHVLPLYKWITVAHIMGAMAASIPLYMLLIYLVNSSASAAAGGLGLASLSGEAASASGAPCLCSLASGLVNLLLLLERLLVAILKAPFKLAHQILLGSASSAGAHNGADSSSNSSRSGGSSSSSSSSSQEGPRPDRIGFSHHGQKSAQGQLNAAYASSLDNLLAAQNQNKSRLAGQRLASNIELACMSSTEAQKQAAPVGQILDCSKLNKQQQQQPLSQTKLAAHCEAPHENSCDANLNDPAYFERAPGMLKRGVSLRNLCKTYFTSSAKLRRIDAVRNVSLDMFYSQILVLLGHNGAGKTTLIDIISGHNSKSSGQILIDGFNIDTHPAEARRRVGFCPQFDVLFERLTVQEHLYFYGIVKGARGELAGEIEDLLAQSGLDVHRNKLSKTLSGGYKRKLSLAIAMIAKSRVLILDEPTSGMDPESRRKVWDFLQLIRQDRLILMTTHHMEEADALGDRIAVMSAGQVKCCGSALFLKKVFNAGYHLRISKSAGKWNQLAFDELIGAKYRLHEKLENVTPHELMYKFDVCETGELLPRLFDELERVKERVGIFGFGITVSTMDDVFMKIGVHFEDVEAKEMRSKFELANGLAKPPGGALGQPNTTDNNNGAAAGSGKQQSSAFNNSALFKRGSASSHTGTSPMVESKGRLEGAPLFRQHVRALLAKRYQHARRNWFQLLWILGVSLACVASVVILIDFVIFKEELTPEWSRDMTLEGAGYGRHTTGVYQFAPPASEEAADFEGLRDQAFPASSNSSTSASRPETTTTTTTTTAATTTATATTVTVTTRERESVTAAPLRPPANAPPDSASSPSGRAAAGARRRRRLAPSATTATATATAAAGALIEGPQVRSTNDSSQFLERFWLPEARANGMASLLTYTDVDTQMIDLLTRQFADFREHYIVGGEKAGRRYIAWYNGEASHSFPISMNIMLNSILKQFTDLIQEQEHPLKGSRISLKHVAMAQINTLIAFLPHLGRLINLVFLPFSLAFITSYFVMFPTHERVTKSKHLQLMTGIPARTFWLSHFLFDLFLYGIYTISVLAIYFVWDRVVNERRIYFANLEHSVALVALVTLFIFGALPLAYIFSFMAKKPTSAFSSFCVLTILTGTATLTLVSLYELKYEHNASAGFKLAFNVFLGLARLIPSVSLLTGLQKLFALNTTRSICINISPEVLELLCRYINSPLVDEELRVLKPERCCRQTCQDECFDQWPFLWTGWFGVNVELAMLVFDALLLWSILIIIESRSIRAQLQAILGRCSPGRLLSPLWLKARKYCWQVPQFNANKDLQQEQLRIDQILASRSTQNYSLVVNDLTKVYSANQFKAVDQLSFVVDKREFFGLLGVNGAGKSSTFKMLTGELRPSSGNAWLGQHDVGQQRRQYLKRIGYCPQQDALIDHLTGAEMLALFARLRGIPERHIELAVEDTLDKLGLSRIGHIECNNYSGGNKRRLSVGMALIGAPEVIFLDEPTSGVDPRSRRRLWSTLIEFQQQTKSSIVMTSHSMNECECLCDRVAIMVGGQFKVLGSIQYLRTRLSQGFSLVLKMKPDQLNNLSELNKSSELIRAYMERTFSSSQLQLRDLHQTIIQFHIQPHKDLTWSKMLVELEKAKQALDLEDYQITSDASLESIFLALAKQQPQQQAPLRNCAATATADAANS